MTTIVECAWCKKEKTLPDAKAKSHKTHFCNLDCKAKWGIFHDQEQGSPHSYINQDFHEVVKTVISEYLNGEKPKYISKLIFHPEIIEKVKDVEQPHKYPTRYIKRVISQVLMSDFGYAYFEGCKTKSKTLCRVD